MIECESCGPSTSPPKPTTREELLQRLVVGDIFHATAPNGASLVCLITKVTKTVIETRRITQENIRFSRTTGRELGGARCTIDSVAPLPIDVHNVILGLDRRHRLARVTADLKLTEAEIAALLFIDSFYPRNAM